MSQTVLEREEDASQALPGVARSAWGNPVLVVGVVAAVVAWVAHFTLKSYFFYDDFIYFEEAHQSHLSPAYLTRQLNVHFSPGYRLVAWVFQSLFPLNFPVAQALLLAGFGAALLVLHAILVRLSRPGPGPLVLTVLYGTSLVHVGVMQWWSSGLQAVPSVFFSLACILGYLQFRRTGSRRMLALSLGALCLGLLFYVKVLLVPVYLVLIHLLVEQPRRPVRESLASMRRELRLWVLYSAPALLYGVVYMTRYWKPSSSPSWSLLRQYLDISWARTFLPAFVGIRVPSAHPSGVTGAAVVAIEVLFVGAVAWSLVRRRAAWRGWVFLGLTFGLNALMVGVPRLTQWGSGIGYFLRYYPEATFLLPIALAAVFVGADSAPPSSAPLPAGAGRRAPVLAGILVVILGAHLTLAWVGAERVSGESPGRASGPYMRNVIASIHRIERSGVEPSIVDGVVPDYVVASWSVYGPPYYNRYSALFPLIDRRLAFNRPGPAMFQVGDHGVLRPATFVAQAGGPAQGLMASGALAVSYGQVDIRGREVCIQSSKVFPARVEFTPPAVLAGPGWYLALTYGSDSRKMVPLFVDHGSGYPYPYDRFLAAPPVGTTSVLADLGQPGLARLRLDLPPGSRTCIDRLEVGRISSPGQPASHQGAPLVVTGAGDSFVRSAGSAGLGAMPGGPPWQAVAGVWAVGGGQARVAVPAGGRSLAVVGASPADGAVQVRLAHLAQGAGLVFRYRDPADYWYVAAVPAYASWAVVKVVGGKAEQVANTGLSPVSDGTTVGVRFTGSTVDVALNEVVVRTITDATLAGPGAVGMTVEGSDARSARFADFRATVTGPGPGPGDAAGSPAAQPAAKPAPPTAP